MGVTGKAVGSIFSIVERDEITESWTSTRMTFNALSKISRVYRPRFNVTVMTLDTGIG